MIMETRVAILGGPHSHMTSVELVPKKDGTTRFYIEYRRLNAVSCKDVYPLPWIEDILSTLEEAKYFTTLDLASGCWQVELEETSRLKTALATHQGLLQFTRIPFGFCNAPVAFQRSMQVILAGLELFCLSWWHSCGLPYLWEASVLPRRSVSLTERGWSLPQAKEVCYSGRRGDLPRADYLPGRNQARSCLSV